MEAPGSFQTPGAAYKILFLEFMCLSVTMFMFLSVRPSVTLLLLCLVYDVALIHHEINTCCHPLSPPLLTVTESRLL